MSYTVHGLVLDSTTGRHVQGAKVEIHCKGKDNSIRETIILYSDAKGRFSADIDEDCECTASAVALNATHNRVPISKDCGELLLRLDIDSHVHATILKSKECGTPEPCHSPVAGGNYEIAMELPKHTRAFEWINLHGADVLATKGG